ncbi:MAG: multicopper oxidase domain-containing protein [Firmicutes bacterium]|nr:multicopper oxidase domain-containing protein [Bacillota bacterium]
MALTVTSILAQPSPLDPLTIPKFVNQLTIPDIYAPKLIKDYYGKVIKHEYTVEVAQFMAQMLPPGYPKTAQLGYGGLVKVPGCSTPVFKRSVPGPTFEMVKGIPALVHWRNKITTPHFLPVDPTLDWANPNNFPAPTPPFEPFPPGYPQAQYPVPIVTHVHGIEVESTFDGHPEAWFTVDGKKGPEYVTNDYMYPNSNNPSTFWYHDHSFGITRLNVQAGLSGFFLLRDPKDKIEPLLPKGKYEIPLLVVDRSFNTDGSLNYPVTGLQPAINPYWNVFLGNTNLVNGKVWPNLDVERRQYRFRILNSSNFRFYEFRLSNGQSFTMIGSDGGYLPQPQTLTAVQLGPTERADILIDFSGLAPGTKVILQNTSPITAFDPNTTGQVMQFTVKNTPACPPCPLPPVLNTLPVLTPNRPTRYMTMRVNQVVTGGIKLLLNGQAFHAPASELPKIGSTEDWDLISLGGTHAIHLHLIQFQVISRQAYDTARYFADWGALNGNTFPLTNPTIELPVEPYLTGSPVPPEPYETGWKDTVRAIGNMVTRIRVRWAPQELPTGAVVPGQNKFPINPFVGPGYIWHCHMLEHEDNELMRPLEVAP